MLIHERTYSNLKRGYMFMKLKMYMYNIRNRKEQIIKSYTYNRQCLIY